jgi:hypothetical protein
MASIGHCVNHIFESLLYFASICIPLILPLIVLSMASVWYMRILGRRMTLVLGLVGVPVHELSHLIMCWMMGCKTVSFSLYKPASDGSLGYVNYSYRPTWYSPFARLLIGLAPIPGALLAIYGLTHLLRPDLISMILSAPTMTGMGNHASTLLSTILSSGNFWQTLCWLLSVFSILLFCSPSKADIAGCRPAIFFILAVWIGMTVVAPTWAHQVLTLASPFIVAVGSLIWLMLGILSVPVVAFVLLRHFIRRRRVWKAH